MNLKPQNREAKPEYPVAGGVSLDRRSFLALFSAAGLAAAALPLLGDDGARAKKKKEPKTIEQAVKWLAAQLGDENFRKRRAATKGLILIGKGEGIGKNDSAKAKKIVLKTMKSLAKHKDPEVTQRAKQVCLAVDPPKKKVPDPPELDIFATAGVTVQ